MGITYSSDRHTKGECVAVFRARIIWNAREDRHITYRWTGSKIDGAEHLNVSQPRISDLMHGRIDKFSVDMLMKWLDRLGRKVTFRIEKKDDVA